MGGGVVLGPTRCASYLKKKCLFIYFEREIQHEQGRDRERGRQGIPNRLCIASAEPDVGLELPGREIMT